MAAVLLGEPSAAVEWPAALANLCPAFVVSFVVQENIPAEEVDLTHYKKHIYVNFNCEIV